MTRLIVWRHGRTEWNATERIQGQADVDLDETGVTQAIEAAPGLVRYSPDRIVSSDLRRARRTAQALGDLVGLPIELDPRLRERDFGPWQGLTAEELRQRYPEEHRRWVSGESLENSGIETLEALAERVTAAFREVAEQLGQGTAVLVTHGGAARAGCGGTLGWPMPVWPSLGVLSNCRHAELRHSADRGWQLRAHNVQ